MEERLAQISNDFSKDRDLYYRKQLQAFQHDIDYIRRADLYADKPLEDNWDDCIEEATSATASIAGSLRAVPPNGNTILSGRIGANAARFAQDINDAIEQRDVDLVTITYRHNSRIDEVQQDCEFNVAVAQQEHQRLVESLRRRLIINLNQKKASMQKEKEKLDIADTHAALLHPSHFTLSSAASPGGPQSNRKTRHTRHRLEVDDLDTVGGNNKRKRKLGDADNGSPAPIAREVEPANIFREANAKLEYHQVTAPLYSLDRLFSQRELDNNCQLAISDVIENFKRRKLNKDSHTSLTSLLGTNADVSDSEAEDNADADADLGADGATEDIFLAAPEMERTATNASQHATRSSRITAPSKNISTRESLGYLAGRAAGAKLIGTVAPKEKRREDEYQRAPPMNDQEVEDDLAVIKCAMEEEDDGRLVNDELLDEVAGHREDQIGTGSTDGEENAGETEE